MNSAWTWMFFLFWIVLIAGKFCLKNIPPSSSLQRNPRPAHGLYPCYNGFWDFDLSWHIRNLPDDIFFCFQLAMRGAPGPQGMTGIPGPAVRDPQFILFLFLTIKYFFLCSNTTCTLNDRLICVIFNKDQHWLCDNVYNGWVCVLLQGPPGMDGPKGDIGNPGEQVLDFYGCFIKLNLSLNSRSTKLSLIIIWTEIKMFESTISKQLSVGNL